MTEPQEREGVEQENIAAPYQLKDRSPRINLRVSPRSHGKICEWMRLIKGPFHDLSVEAGCYEWDVYNRHLHPRKYFKGKDALLKEYAHLSTYVTLWNVACERQIRVKGPEAKAFVERVVSRDINQELLPGNCLYVLLCNKEGGIVCDPVLLRPGEDEFWFSISDSGVREWLQGINIGWEYDVEIKELDVAPLQIQGPLSASLMVKIVGEEILAMPYYGLRQIVLNKRDVTISRTGFVGSEIGFEVYVHDATKYGEEVARYLLKMGEEFNLRFIAPSHIKALEAGILSWGQDMDHQNNPYEVRLGWQVDRPYRVADGVLVPKPTKRELDEGLVVRRPKTLDYIGKEAHMRIKQDGVTQCLVGLVLGGRRILDYNEYFYHILDPRTGGFVGYVTRIFYSPAVGSNIALAMVPTRYSSLDTRLKVVLPGQKTPVNAVVTKVPFVQKKANQELRPITDWRLKAAKQNRKARSNE